MKATYNGIIKQIHNNGGNVEVKISFSGKVENTKVVGDARNTTLEATLCLKEVIANQLKLGSVFTLALNVEEPEGST